MKLILIPLSHSKRTRDFAYRLTLQDLHFFLNLPRICQVKASIWFLEAIVVLNCERLKIQQGLAKHIHHFNKSALLLSQSCDASPRTALTAARHCSSGASMWSEEENNNRIMTLKNYYPPNFFSSGRRFSAFSTRINETQLHCFQLYALMELCSKKQGKNQAFLRAERTKGVGMLRLNYLEN